MLRIKIQNIPKKGVQLKIRREIIKAIKAAGCEESSVEIEFSASLIEIAQAKRMRRNTVDVSLKFLKNANNTNLTVKSIEDIVTRTIRESVDENTSINVSIEGTNNM